MQNVQIRADKERAFMVSLLGVAQDNHKSSIHIMGYARNTLTSTATTAPAAATTGTAAAAATTIPAGTAAVALQAAWLIGAEHAGKQCAFRETRDRRRSL